MGNFFFLPNCVVMCVFPYLALYTSVHSLNLREEMRRVERELCLNCPWNVVWVTVVAQNHSVCTSTRDVFSQHLRIGLLELRKCLLDMLGFCSTISLFLWGIFHVVPLFKGILVVFIMGRNFTHCLLQIKFQLPCLLLFIPRLLSASVLALFLIPNLIWLVYRLKMLRNLSE